MEAAKGAGSAYDHVILTAAARTRNTKYFVDRVCAFNEISGLQMHAKAKRLVDAVVYMSVLELDTEECHSARAGTHASDIAMANLDRRRQRA